MKVLQRALRSNIGQQMYQDGNHYWERGAIPYLGTYIEPSGGETYNWEKYFADDVNIKHPENIKLSQEIKALQC